MNSLSLGVLLQRLKNDVVVYTVQCTRVQCTYMRRVSTTWCYILEFGFFLAVVFTFSPPPTSLGHFLFASGAAILSCRRSRECCLCQDEPWHQLIK